MGEAKEVAKRSGQMVALGLRSRHRHALIEWFAGRKWKGYEERRKRRFIREGLAIRPDFDYRTRTEKVGVDKDGHDLFARYTELGRFVGDENDPARKFQKITKETGRLEYLFEITGEQVDWLIKAFGESEVADASADAIVEIEDAMQRTKVEGYEPPDLPTYHSLAAEAFEDTEDSGNDDEVE